MDIHALCPLDYPPTRLAQIVPARTLLVAEVQSRAGEPISPYGSALSIHSLKAACRALASALRVEHSQMHRTLQSNARSLSTER